jgi:raffinose/stachyose/melibiose transport system substrate-binding protein
MKRLIVIMVLAGIAASGFAAGQQESAGAGTGPVTLTLLEVPEQMWEGFKAVIAEWEKRTGNKMEVQILPNDQIYPVLISRINAGEAPDIYMSDGRALEFTLPPGSMARLNERPFFSAIPDATKELLVTSDGSLPYIPLVPLNAAGVAYNKKIYRDAGVSEPKNRKEFIAVCEKIKQAGVAPLNYQGASGHAWGVGFWFMPIAAYYDKYFAPKDYWDQMNTNKRKFSDNQFYVSGLQQLVEYVDKGFVNKDPLSTTFDNTKDNMAYGKVAMTVAAEWIYGPVMERTPDFEMGFYPLPVEDDREGIMASFIGTGISVWNGSKKKEVALQFMDFLCTKEMQELFYTLTPGTPIFPSAKVKLTPIGESITRYSERGLASPRWQMYDKLYLHTEFTKLMQDLVNKQKSPKQVMEAYDRARVMAGQQKNLPGF